MSRLMSVRLTEEAVVERRKTVTRRLGWLFLKPGDRLTLCRKVQGRKKGEPLVRLAEVEVTYVERVKLDRSFDGHPDDLEREGVPTTLWFWRPDFDISVQPTLRWVWWFCDAMRCAQDTPITRIEWRYLEGGAS